MLDGLTWDPAGFGLPGPFLDVGHPAPAMPRCMSMLRGCWPLPLLGLAAAFLPESATAEPPATLAAMRWHHRILLVFAQTGDPRLAAQRQLLSGEGAGVADRDLTIVEVVGPQVRGAADTAPALRDRYAVPGDGFAAILIGKDGGEKLRSGEPIATGRLFATIDAMPMRRSETKR